MVVIIWNKGQFAYRKNFAPPENSRFIYKNCSFTASFSIIHHSIDGWRRIFTSKLEENLIDVKKSSTRKLNLLSWKILPPFTFFPTLPLKRAKGQGVDNLLYHALITRNKLEQVEEISSPRKKMQTLNKRWLSALVLIVKML